MKSTFTQGFYLALTRVTRRSLMPVCIVVLGLSATTKIQAQLPVPQAIPFSQNWTNPALITANDDWSGVAGILGFLGDIAATSTTGVDPQTLLSDYNGVSAVDVIANQTNVTITNGGVAEFDNFKHVVAMQGSGAADAPFLLIGINTTGFSSIQVSYNIKDIDSTSDNSIQAVALQYRIGNSGAYTNVPAAFVADATTGPGFNDLVTPVNVTLPAGADNQTEVYLRIMTTNAAGSDEWVGIDDIVITGTPLPPPCSLTGTGLFDVHCEDNNESSDPSDDYIWFQLHPTGSNLGTGYNVTVSSGSVLWNGNTAATNVPYGADEYFRLQAGSAGSGNVTITVTDATTGTCFVTSVVVDPGSCSQPPPPVCSIDASGISGLTCDNNGTPTNTADDFITFFLNPTGTDLSLTYSLTVSSGTVTLFNGNPATGVSYGAATQFRLQNGSAGAGNVNVFIADDADPDCVFTQPIADPGFCSNPCDLLITAVSATNETCANSNDGTITITATCTTCSNGIEYSADGVNYQPTNVITGLSDGVYTVYARAIGNNQCADTDNATILNGDGTAPVFNLPLPQNLTISCTDPVPPAPTLTANDNVDLTPTVTLSTSTTPGNCPQESVIVRTWTATDDCNNSAQVVQTITIEDNTAPVFNAPLPQNITLSCDAPLPLAPQVTATDACDPGQVPPVIFINEFHYDNIGTDAGEFIEVAGTAGLDLSQYAIVLYNGNGGVEYGPAPVLTGLIDNEGSGFGAVSFSMPVNGIQNGTPDGMALIKLPSTVLQFISYEGPFLATNGPAAGMTSTDIGVQEDGLNPLGTSVQLTGAGQVYSNFTWVGPLSHSAGTLNAGQTISALPGTIIAVMTETSMMGDCAGETIVKRSWTATDACGNSATYMQTISLLDGTAPTFVPPLPQNITISCSDPVPPAANMLATDNCDDGMSGTAQVWINEMHYDNNGTDVNEFIEVAGTSGTDLSGYSLFLYNGAGGGTYSSMLLAGTIDNESNGFGAVSFAYPLNGLQNGAPDGVALVHGGMVVQFLSYEGVFMAVGGPANGMTSTDIGVSETGLEPAGQSLRLTGNGNTYANFIWNAPAAESPGIINPGQTFVAVPVGLQVTFNEVTTPGTCPQERTITRTWSVSDDCDNTKTHQQIITVDDFTAPVVTCQPLTVNLDLDGSVTITQANVSYSAIDNCSAANTLVYNPASLTLTCVNAGTTVPFVLTVTDQCGNTGSCTTQVTVPAYDRCTPTIEIVDPCVCKNNATTLTNGQFGEKIYIKSLTNKIWTITAVSGLYSNASPAPPAAPIAITPGMTFTEIPVGSGDYYLDGIHVDAIGYSITVKSQTGETLVIGNNCSYPNPAITSDLSGPFCLYSDPVTLTGTPGDANYVSAVMTVNGVPTTTFDPADGVGQYVIKYTVDGGIPKAFGANDPGCVQSITVLINVVSTPPTVSCNDLVQISLDDDCISEVTPDMILEGTYGCFDDYIVEMDITLPLGNGPWIPAIVDAGDIGKTYTVKVTHLVSGNTCWGNIKIEDKLPPVLDCAPVHLSCAIPNCSPACLNQLGVPDVYPVVTENCSNYNLNFDDTWYDLGCGGSVNGVTDLSAYIIRVWTAIDASGNLGTCTQYIYFHRRHVNDVQLPPDVTVSCTNPATDPNATGMPYLVEFGHQYGLFPNNTYCELQTVYTDQVLPVCDGTYKILRTWTIYDWCLPTDPFGPNPNPKYHIQVIKVVDDQGPTVACPQDMTVSTDPFTCVSTPDLPDVIITDECSRIASIVAHYKVDGITYTLNGTLTSFPGNNLWVPDTLGRMGFAQNLPLGITEVTYVVTDDCGNSSECTFDVTVQDQVPPVSACDEFTQVALGISGESWINASTFDDGSYDNCSAVEFKVRRMNQNDCDDNSQFDDQVKFCCSDVGDTVTVIFRVYDVDVPAGEVSLTFQELHANDCMVQVFVEDKIKPACVPPAHVTTSCENFDPTLWNLYGWAQVSDNCCLDDTKVYQGQIGLTHTANYSQFDTLCNKGTIVRTFRAYDCYGNSSQCTQRIVVNYEQDYYVKFPNDVIVTECNGSGNYGEPTFFGEDCEMLGVSFHDEVFTVVPDACFKIERTWRIINWCTYNTNLPCINVPNPNPNSISNHPSNLPGPIVSALGTPAPWAPTVVKINPTDPVATNYSTFWQANANCYEYKQIIKIIDTEDPVFANCPATDQEICDWTNNDPLFWNDPNMPYWDGPTQSHDLCEAPADLCITVTDSCGGAEVDVNYILFLDMDGNGTWETQINSNNPPAPNTIPYLGGTSFDHRAVPANQKYRFNVDWTTTGNARTACVRWDNLAQPANLNDNVLQGVVPQLPYGTHKIKWIAQDGCGNESVCEYIFTVKDCKKPTVVCLNGLSVNIMPTGMIQMWAGDFLQYGEDNCTPANLLQYGIVESDESTGAFPVDAQGNPQIIVTFDCNEIGSQAVQLWAMDLAGNADFCETYIIVQDNANNCSPTPISVAGVLATENLEGVEEASVQLTANHPIYPAVNLSDFSDGQGAFGFPDVLPVDANYTVTPLKDDNPLNGVTTYDLVLISKHILGLETFDSPYKMIAADANKSNSITTFDIVEFRKLILGIYDELPNNTSWRFIDESFNFTDPTNPFIDVLPETISVAGVQIDNLANNFVGVKLGDVNGTAIPNGLLSSDDRSSGTLMFDLDERHVNAGEEFEVHFKAADKVLGYQFTLALANLEVLDIVPGAEMTTGNFGVFTDLSGHAGTDAITTSFDGKATGEFTVKFRAKAAGNLSNMIGVSSRITKSEAYVNVANETNVVRNDIALRFNKDNNTNNATIVTQGFELYQNTPNPWENRTVIGFHLPEAGSATLSVFDENGRLLYSADGTFAKGYNAFTVERAQVNAHGVLYYKVETASGNSTMKMVEIK